VRTPRELVVLLVGTFVNRVGTCVAPFLALYLTAERGLSLEEAGGIVSLMGLASIASGPVGGAIADRIGRRFAMGFATATGAAAMIALGFSRTTTEVAGAAFLLGFFGDLYRPAVAAIVADIVPSEGRARAYGLLHWVVNLGFAGAMAIGGLVAAKSFRLLFAIDAATTAAFGALVVAAVKESRPAADPARPRRSLAAPYADGLFVAFLAATLLVTFTFLQGHVAYPMHLRANGLSARAFGGLLALNGALIGLLQPLVSSRLARLPRAPVLAAGALLAGFGWGMTELGGSSIPLYAAAVAVWTAGEMAAAPVTPAIIADFAPGDLRATYQGAYQITFGLASFAAPAIGWVMLQRVGSGALWGGCAALGVVSAVAYAVIVPRAERRRSTLGARAGA
jgi:MFS family permease